MIAAKNNLNLIFFLIVSEKNFNVVNLVNIVH